MTQLRGAVLASILALIPALSACRGKSTPSTQDVTPIGVKQTLNGLLVIDAPPPFTLVETRGNVVMLESRKGASLEVLMFMAVKEAPAAIDDFAKPLEAAVLRAHADYANHLREPTKCLGEDALRIAGTFGSGATRTYRNACYFFHRGNGFALVYTLAFDVPAQRRVQLEEILAKSSFPP